MISYQLYEVESMSIAGRTLTFLTGLGNIIEYEKIDTKGNRLYGYIENSFSSVEECNEKVQELFKRNDEEYWDYLSISKSNNYTCIPKLKFK